ncbi:cell division protein ZapC [Photobacterium proteolyticum]|uniref:Cell division protein ZapC n=1 Tax=Photobacterium proteolyticum TaxID=1903952 RepID=A0A1Q9G6Q1_9GAMM|nr:cell division protein ZapC [Photobacterium proteolyticum]OLQ69988.1 cell division protein ZapC [Photobacterium proteolyticum]
MLKPTDSWTWYYDHKDDSLMLDLGEEMVFRVSIPTKHLVTSAFERTVFTVDDATIYQGFLENIAQLELSAPRKVELALNAVAASRFHKPMMPKSWFFETQQGGCEPENGDVVTLQTEFGAAKYLVIENSGCASLCMLADVEPLALTSTKEMTFCDTIKVMNDRMQAFVNEMPVNFALVG